MQRLALSIMTIGALMLSGCSNFGDSSPVLCRITDVGADARRDGEGNEVHVYSYTLVSDVDGAYDKQCKEATDVTVTGSYNTVTLAAQEKMERPGITERGSFHCPSDPWSSSNAGCTRDPDGVTISSDGPGISQVLLAQYGGATAPLSTEVLVAIDIETLRGQVGNAVKRLPPSPAEMDAMVDMGGCACADRDAAPKPDPKPAGPSVPNTGPVVQKGASGLKVEALQLLLNQNGADVEVDGDFGDQTESAVKVLQQRKGIVPVDGKVNAQTWAALFLTISKGAPQTDAVKALQTLLNFQGRDVEVDGDYGDQTFAAIKAFQSAHGLSANGTIGPSTWAALVNK